MKIYSQLHRAIVEAPILTEPRVNYWGGINQSDADKIMASRDAYDKWLTTHIPVLTEHQHLFKDGQEVKEGIDYEVVKQIDTEIVSRNSYSSFKQKVEYQIAIPIKQQVSEEEVKVHEELWSMYEECWKARKGGDPKFQAALFGEKVADWIEENSHKDAVQQVSGGHTNNLNKII